MTQLYPGGRVPGKAGRDFHAAEEEGVKFFDFLGVKTLAEARALDAEYIRDKAVEYKGFWGTVVDGKFSTGVAFDLFRENKRHMVPVLFGHTSTEFPSVPNVSTMEEFRAMAKDLFGEDADEFLALCPSQFDSVTEVKKKASVIGIEYAIRILSQANADTGANAPLYYYNFDPSIPGWDNPGTFHSVDLWFFFETLAKCWRPFTGKHYDLARLMCNYWGELHQKRRSEWPRRGRFAYARVEEDDPGYPERHVLRRRFRRVWPRGTERFDEVPGKGIFQEKLKKRNKEDGFGYPLFIYFARKRVDKKGSIL